MQPSSKTSHHRLPNAQSQKNSSDCYVTVSDYPQYTLPEDLERAFKKFGLVGVKDMNNKFATLSVPNKDIMKKVVEASKEVQVYGKYLKVIHYNPKQAAPVKRELKEKKQKDEIINPADINLSGDFNEQLDRILEAVVLTQHEITSFNCIYTDLKNALQVQWPGCTVEPFGSITTGLGSKNSDADCLIKFPPNVGTEATGPELVNKACSALRKYPNIFYKIEPIPRVNMPIVKLFHKPTKKYCDVTFKSLLGTQNSKLIAFLLHSDPRLLPMALVIKYWAKVHKLSGTTKLKNYALSMLIIFYLQQPPISILPSIWWLQKDPANDVFIDNWNAGFMNQKNMLPPSSNTSSIAELLGGFFEYYSKFDFQEMVVCPYLGRPIEKELFNNIHQLPNEFERCKSNAVSNGRPMKFKTAMCVQDPFDHLHNVGSPVSNNLLPKIKSYLKYAANAYVNEKLLNNNKYFFKAILLGKVKLSKIQSEYKVNVPIVNIIKLDWKNILRQIMLTLFEKMLKVQLEVQKENQEQEVYRGTISKVIWKRNFFSKINMTELEFQQEQEKITEKILNEERQLIGLQFLLTLTYSQNPVISFKMINGDENAFYEFGNFFISMMNHWYKKLLNSYIKLEEKDTVA